MSTYNTPSTITRYQHYARLMRRFAIGGLLALLTYLFILSFFTPSFKELENPSSNQASLVYAMNGEVLGPYYIENRVPVTYNELSPNLVKALIATEDERFYDHAGVDAKAVGRVVYGIFTGHSRGGGSTITQQLAKLLYSDRNFKGMNFIQKFFALSTRKFSEWITAVKLERRYTKEEIIAMYLNQFNFINGAYGIRAASEIYFGKSQDSLNLEEAALLVGMLNNPSYYNPIRRPEKAKERRNIVLGQMLKNNMITESVFYKARAKDLGINLHTKTHADGLAPYFRAELEKDIKEILSRPECLKSDGSKYDIYKDGLKIYTTIDPEMQRQAEAAMMEHMAVLQKRYETVWKGRDPWTYKDAETTDEELKTRQSFLTRQIRESDRYQLLRSKYLEDATSAISDKFDDFNLQDFDIDRMVEEENHPGYLSNLEAKRLIDPKKSKQLSRIMGDPVWNDLKKAWNRFQIAVKNDFSKPTKMAVFAYNARAEKDTVMTPMDSIRYHRMFLQLGSIAVDPTDGSVKAWVGGINHKYFQYDHIRTSRQVGSTFKPFVYATAIAQQGISPCTQVVDVPQTISVGEGNFHLIKPWTPKNANGYSGSTVTLFDALKGSINTVSVYLTKQIGSVQPIIGLIHNMGIDSTLRSANGDYRIPRQPAICLGAADLSVMEMTGAYTTFANNGIYTKPIYLTRIENKNGKVIYQSVTEQHPAMNEKANYVMVKLLKYVVSEANGVAGLKSEVGGKTGTTNHYVDGWFMGVTPRLVVGTWVGGEDPWIRFLSIADGQGSHMARPFFAKFMHRIENDPKVKLDTNAHFNQPQGDLGITIDCAEFRREQGAPINTTEFGDHRFEDEEPVKKPDENQ